MCNREMFMIISNNLVMCGLVQKDPSGLEDKLGRIKG